MAYACALDFIAKLLRWRQGDCPLSLLPQLLGPSGLRPCGEWNADFWGGQHP